MKTFPKIVQLVLLLALPLYTVAQDKNVKPDSTLSNVKSIEDYLPYVESKLDVKFKQVTSKKGGVEVIETGPNNRIVGNWPGPKKWTITYAGPTDQRKDATEIHTIKDLLTVLISLREQKKTTAYFALQRNGSIPKIFHADISDLNFAGTSQNYNGQKNSLVNLTVGGITPLKIRDGDSNCIVVIGRDMCRVSYYVSELKIKFKSNNTHIETWDSGVEEKYRYNESKPLDENVNKDGDWLCDRIKKGCTVIDIGCDEKYVCPTRPEKPTYDCSVSSPYYQREQLIAFGSYECYKPHYTTVTPTDVKPTDVKPTDVNKKKNFRPFTRSDGSFKPIDFYIGAGVAFKNKYAEGKPLHDFIYRYASAVGQNGGTGGSFGYFPVYSGFSIPLNKQKSSFIGGEIHYVKTFKQAIVAFSTFGGYEIFLRANMVNVCATAGYGFGPMGKLSMVVETGLVLGSMKGEMAFAPGYERLEESHANGLGFTIAGGLNARTGLHTGVRVRAGQRMLKIMESHKDPGGSGYTTFYVNGTDGEKLTVDWSGFFSTICFDLYF